MWSMAGSILIWLLNQLMKRQKLDEDMKKAYYDFLEQANKKGLTKGALWQAGEESRDRLIDRVESEYEKTQDDGSD